MHEREKVNAETHFSKSCPGNRVFAVTEDSVNFVIAPSNHKTTSSFDDSNWSKLDGFLAYTCFVT